MADLGLRQDFGIQAFGIRKLLEGLSGFLGITGFAEKGFLGVNKTGSCFFSQRRGAAKLKRKNARCHSS